MDSLIIDGSVTFGGDPTGRSDCSLDTLRHAMDRHGITVGCAFSQLAVRMDPKRGNDEAIALAAKDTQFRPVAVLDPRHSDTGAREIERCVSAGVRLFRLFPKIHQYPWVYEPLLDIWQNLQKEKAALIVPRDWTGSVTEFLRVTKPYSFVKILEGCHYWTFTEYRAALVHYPETCLMALAPNAPGFFETLVSEIGSHRICFGSNAPIYYIGAGLMVLQHAQIAEHDRSEILGGTMQRLLGEKP